MAKCQQVFIVLLLCMCFRAYASVLTPFTSEKGDENIEQTQLYNDALDGDAKAQFDLASYYASQKENYSTILLWLRRSANQDYLEAQFALGKIYHFGKPGVPPDLMEAEEWYEKAAQKGDKQALHYLNVLRRQPAYRVESKPTIDDKWDLQWTAKTASYGDMQSQFELGRLYAEGRKIQMDYTLAAQWYEKAAVQGHEEAMTSLGALYLDGKGVASSVENALFWYNQAALRDYIPAQQKLYEIYIKDDEKTQDLVKAASWLYISLTFLFPDEKDLTKVSPQLEELWNKFTQQQKEEVLFFVYSFIDKVRKK